MFFNTNHFHLSKIFGGQPAWRNVCLLDLPVNIKLGWKLLTVTNTLAYYGTELITAENGFMMQAWGGKGKDWYIGSTEQHILFKCHRLKRAPLKRITIYNATDVNFEI